MGVRILEGTYDGATERQRAVLVDSATETAFGQLFDSADQAEAFLTWLPEDPRSYTDAELQSAQTTFAQKAAAEA